MKKSNTLFEAAPLPDWAMRTAGVVMLLALAGSVYSIVKGGMET